MTYLPTYQPWFWLSGWNSPVAGPFTFHRSVEQFLQYVCDHNYIFIPPAVTPTFDDRWIWNRLFNWRAHTFGTCRILTKPLIVKNVSWPYGLPQQQEMWLQYLSTNSLGLHVVVWALSYRNKLPYRGLDPKQHWHKSLSTIFQAIVTSVVVWYR